MWKEDQTLSDAVRDLDEKVAKTKAELWESLPTWMSRRLVRTAIWALVLVSKVIRWATAAMNRVAQRLES